MKKRFLFVVNPIAGGKNKEELPLTLERFCTENGYSFLIYFTQGHKNDPANIAAVLKEEEPDGIIAVGGDGTVNLVGEVIVGTSIPLGIIPMGSGNGLAKDLNIPDTITDALQLINEFRPHPIDTLRLNGRNCFHVSDFGFNARIVRRFSKSLKRGKLSYIWFGLQEYFSLKSFNYIIETEKGGRYHGSAFMMAVINGNKFGTNANINPTGSIDDGYFEISIIKPFSRWKSFNILYRLFHNDIHKSEYNQVIHCKKAAIYNCDNTSFHIDGEPAHPGKKIEVEIVPKGLYILMPDKSKS